jgi:hypothetical protein
MVVGVGMIWLSYKGVNRKAIEKSNDYGHDNFDILRIKKVR